MRNPLPPFLNQISTPIVQWQYLQEGEIPWNHVRYLLGRWKGIKHEQYLILTLLIHTGMTIPEVLNLRARDLDISKNSLRVSGNLRLTERKLQIDNWFALELFRFIPKNHSEEFVFSSRGHSSKKRTERSIQKILLQFKRELGFPFSICSIRDALGLHFWRAGLSVSEIQDFLGYKSKKSTRKRLESKENRCFVPNPARAA